MYTDAQYLKKHNSHDDDNNTSSIFIFVNDKLSSPKSSDDVQSEKRPPDRLVCHNFQDCHTTTLLLQDAIITRAECICIFEVFLSLALSAVGIEAQPSFAAISRIAAPRSLSYIENCNYCSCQMQHHFNTYFHTVGIESHMWWSCICRTSLVCQTNNASLTCTLVYIHHHPHNHHHTHCHHHHQCNVTI